MQGTTHTETDAYKLVIGRSGIYAVLIRKYDGADVCLQGEACDRVLEEAEELADCWQDKPARFVEFFNYWASQYDEVMETRN